MATLKNGIMGGFSGRLGNLVVYEMFGKTVIRTLPSVKQKKASGKRKQYQDDFRYVMRWMQHLKPLLDMCWNLEPPHKKAFKPAFSYNLKRYRDLGRPNNFDWLQVFQNGANALQNLALTYEEDLFILKWELIESDSSIQSKDTAYISLVNINRDEAFKSYFYTNADNGYFEQHIPNWKASDRIVAFVVVAYSSKPGYYSETYSCLIYCK